MARETLLKIQLSVPGRHHWPNAKGNVEFLKYPHTHTFVIECFIKVTGLDREIEFYQMAARIKTVISTIWEADDLGIHEFENYSCEMIADYLVTEFNLMQCVVSEDGLFGAVVQRWEE